MLKKNIKKVLPFFLLPPPPTSKILTTKTNIFLKGFTSSTTQALFKAHLRSILIKNITKLKKRKFRKGILFSVCAGCFRNHFSHQDTSFFSSFPILGKWMDMLPKPVNKPLIAQLESSIECSLFLGMLSLEFTAPIPIREPFRRRTSNSCLTGKEKI